MVSFVVCKGNYVSCCNKAHIELAQLLVYIIDYTIKVELILFCDMILFKVEP